MAGGRGMRDDADARACQRAHGARQRSAMHEGCPCGGIAGGRPGDSGVAPRGGALPEGTAD
eukprot:1141908-Alexandrium_andersonii.AAC.1